MGLFADAADYGGTFYRSFDQSLGGEDLGRYFGEFQIARGFVAADGETISGVCAGCCYSWIKHYLNRPVIAYSNEIMKNSKEEIMTVQLWVRKEGVLLADLLEQSGMAANGFNMVVVDDHIALVATNELKNQPGIYTLSFRGHVVVCFVDAVASKVYFMDVHKGDVSLPLGSSGIWLLKYLTLMSQKHGPVFIRGFTATWHTDIAGRKFAEMQEALDAGPNPPEIDADWERVKDLRLRRPRSNSQSRPAPASHQPQGRSRRMSVS